MQAALENVFAVPSSWNAPHCSDVQVPLLQAQGASVELNALE